MKGYSFDELVKLAAAAVKRAGDTMTGNLTAPKVLVSGEQGTEVNALTRRDYVDTELAKKLNLTGGTLTGNLTAPAVLVSSAQNTSANALTRKDYVDSAIATGDALQVSKSGDTMTGTLTLSSSTFGTAGVSTGAAFAGMYGNTRVPHIVDATTSGSSYAPALAARYFHNAGWNGIYSLGVLNYNTQSPGSFCVHHINSDGGQDLIWSFEGASGNFTAPGAIFTQSAQNSHGSALTRKDYVDSQVATRAPTAHTHTAADVGAVSKNGDIMTGALQVRSGVNASGVHVYGGGGGGVVGLVDATGTQRTNFHYNGATGIGSINTYNASGAWVSEVAKWDSANGFGVLYPYSTSPQSVSANALTRKDYVDGQVATRAPTTHNHTAAQGNSDIVASGYGQIGTYAMLKSVLNSNLGPGSTVDGNSLQYVSCSGASNYAAPSPGGTWKCLGISNAYKNNEGSGSTLWVRIA